MGDGLFRSLGSSKNLHHDLLEFRGKGGGNTNVGGTGYAFGNFARCHHGQVGLGNDGVIQVRARFGLAAGNGTLS